MVLKFAGTSAGDKRQLLGVERLKDSSVNRDGGENWAMKIRDEMGLLDKKVAVQPTVRNRDAEKGSHRQAGRASERFSACVYCITATVNTSSKFNNRPVSHQIIELGHGLNGKMLLKAHPQWHVQASPRRTPAFDEAVAPSVTTSIFFRNSNTAFRSARCQHDSPEAASGPTKTRRRPETCLRQAMQRCSRRANSACVKQVWDAANKASG